VNKDRSNLFSSYRYN